MLLILILKNLLFREGAVILHPSQNLCIVPLHKTLSFTFFHSHLLQVVVVNFGWGWGGGGGIVYERGGDAPHLT